ncbi:unnamed protein product, partial [Adineta steineri]
PDIFNQLYVKYPETLKCTCSNVTLPYETFVSHKITFHPVCSSIFIAEKWIRELYLSNASQYGVRDFRTTAHSQFELLAKFCLLSGQIVQQNRIDIDKNEFVTIDLLSEEQVQIQRTQKSLETSDLCHGLGLDEGTCETDNPVVTTTFTLYSGKLFTIDMRKELKQWVGSPYIEGFFAGCTPLEGLLESTLDCLYDMKCVQLLIDNFPTLNRLNISFMDSILVSPKQNKTVYDHLSDLFTDEWSIDTNYSKYYSECAPTSCTYTIIDQINFSYAFTLLISIYGGLIIILRLIAPFLVNISMKFNCCSRNRGIHLWSYKISLNRLGQSAKRLNLFKTAEDRTENSIKQQKITTYVYLILLTGSLLVLIIFTSLSTQTVTIHEVNPSLMIYKDLQAMYSSTLKCPCSNIVIRYDKFMSLSPTLHQVCSSNFVHDGFLSVLNGKGSSETKNDWTIRAFSHFQLLTKLCRLANETIKAAVDRFIMRSIVISNVLNENDFNTQINVTLDQFYQSTIADFRFAVDIQRLFVQIDQPYTGKAPTGHRINCCSHNVTMFYEH